MKNTMPCSYGVLFPLTRWPKHHAGYKSHSAQRYERKCYIDLSKMTLELRGWMDGFHDDWIELWCYLDRQSLIVLHGAVPEESLRI